MAISTEIMYASLSELFLDPLNPRLGRHNSNSSTPQDKILEMMSSWKLDELAVSFLESGVFWTQEALIVIREKIYGKPSLVVLEGNRRLAALKYLDSAFHGNPADSKWSQLVKGTKKPSNLFKKIPYYLVDSRDDIESFLGFRHVTGIEEWRPTEKAEFISRLVDKGMSYQEVMRKIGSKTPAVRQNYIAYRILLQIEKVTDIPSENYEDRFSVMYLSLRTDGVQRYLRIDIAAEPDDVRRYIPKIHKKALANFALWLFGDETHLPLFTDSRYVDRFGQVLESDEACKYLERTENPSFEIAFRTAGGDEPELISLLEVATDNIELSLTRVHHYKSSKKLQTIVERLSKDSNQLLEIFPNVKAKLQQELDSKEDK